MVRNPYKWISKKEEEKKKEKKKAGEKPHDSSQVRKIIIIRTSYLNANSVKFKLVENKWQSVLYTSKSLKPNKKNGSS